MDVRGSEAGSTEWLTPGVLVEGRFRVANIVTRRTGGRAPEVVVCNGLDERTRQRVRLRFAPGRPDARVLELKHAMLPTAVAAGPSPRGAWVATAWFDGEPLRLPEAPMVGDDAVHLWAEALADVLDLLDRLHRTLGRAHGGLGLHSFWVGDDGRLRMMDATAPDTELRPDVVPWAAPERVSGSSSDPRTDLYAVAAVFYGLATARAPFGTEVAAAKAGHRALRLPDHESLPPEILAVLRTAMEKQPHHRFGSAERMRAALAKAVADWESQATVLPLPDAPRPAPTSLAPERIPVVPYVPAPDDATEGIELEPDEEMASWEGTLEPSPKRTRRPARSLRTARPHADQGPAASMLIAAVAGVGLSLAAWIAVGALLLTLARG